MPSYRFDLATAVEPIGDGRFAGHLDEQWAIGPVPNGGYVMSLMLRAATQVLAHPDPFSTTAHFLSPTATGPVEALTEVVKPGRSTTTVMTTLHQGERERIRMLTTFGDLDTRSGPTMALTAPPTVGGPFEEGVADFGGFPANFEFRMPASVAGGVMGRPTGTPELGGTIAFVDGRNFDVVSLPTAADGFPPVAFNLGHRAWTPTLELTIHVWGHPAPGPLTVWLHSAAVVGGYHDESADIWDSGGVLVARSRQLAAIL